MRNKGREMQEGVTIGGRNGEEKWEAKGREKVDRIDGR